MTYLSSIERGERNPALENLHAIATALDLVLSDLFRFRGGKTAAKRMASAP